MGAGGGASGPNQMEVAQNYYRNNPGATMEELQAVGGGMSPLAYRQGLIGKDMINQNSPMAEAMFQRTLNMEKQANAFNQRMGQYVQGQRDWANGGMLYAGLGQVRKGLNAGQGIAEGAANRSMSRFGVNMSPEAQAQMDQQMAMNKASTQVGVMNQARLGLSTAARDMRFNLG